MVQSNAKIRYLEHEREEKEKLIKMMESSGTGAATEDRIAALEKKMKEMEALMKGLTQELLDLKAIAMKLSKQTEERSRQELKRVQPIIQSGQQPQAAAGGMAGGTSTVVVRKGAKQAEAESAKPAEPAMDMIMQNDGTMKLERRRGEKGFIVASAGYGRNKKGTSKPKQGELIYATDEEKKDPAKK